MVTLYLAIHNGEPKELKFDFLVDLKIYITQLKDFNCIWLITDGDNEKNPSEQEILITESTNELIRFVREHEPKTVFIQEYKTYENAYRVALDMRETNPKCYNL